MAERAREESRVKTEEEGQVGAVRRGDGRWTTYGNNIERDGNKTPCCLVRGKRAQGREVRWGRRCREAQLLQYI